MSAKAAAIAPSLVIEQVSQLLDVLGRPDVAVVERFVEAVDGALSHSSRTAIKTARCRLRALDLTAQQYKIVFRWLLTLAGSLQGVQQHRNYVHLLSDILYWAGEPPPEGMLEGVRPFLSAALRGVYHANDATTADRDAVEALLGLWTTRQHFDGVTVKALAASLRAPAQRIDGSSASEKPIATLPVGAHQFGDPGLPYYCQPASLMLDSVPRFEQKTDLHDDRLVPASTRVTQRDIVVQTQHVQAVRTYLRSCNDEAEDDAWSLEESELDYLGWSLSFWKERAVLT